MPEAVALDQAPQAVSLHVQQTSSLGLIAVDLFEHARDQHPLGLGQ